MELTFSLSDSLGDCWTNLSIPLFDHLEIETIGSCNRKCPTCLRQTYIHKDNPVHLNRFPITHEIGQGTKMPFSTFKNIIDQAVKMGFSGRVCMQHYNEPLLDDRLADLAAYVKSKPEIKGPLFSCINMDIITEDRAKELDGLFDFFVVSLYMSKKKQEEREPWLLSLFKKTQLVFTKGVHVITHYSPAHQLNDLIKQQSTKPCNTYNNMLIIAYDGTILHCCDDYIGHFNIGNVNTMSLKEIWESQTHQKLIKTLAIANGRQKYKYCSVCPR